MTIGEKPFLSINYSPKVSRNRERDIDIQNRQLLPTNIEQSILSPVQTYHSEIFLLLILHISVWGCLIRCDYNFIFLFFAYFHLITKKDHASIDILFYLSLLLIVMDLFFFILVPQNWMKYQQHNILWNNLRGLHGFAIFIAALVFLLKIPLTYLLYCLRKQIAIK